MKTGLILEGGTMRGMFTAGVLNILMENGIEVDGVIGVSAGTVFGCNYKSKQIGRTIRYKAKYCNDLRYCSLRSLIRTGNLYGNEFCYHEIPEKLDIFDIKTYEENPVEFYATCIDVDTGKPVYRRIDKIDDSAMEWMRASASMPLASRPVEVNGRRMLDSGISDSIPLQYFESIGYDRNIVILTQPKGYIKKNGCMMPVISLLMRKMPWIVSAMQKRPIHRKKENKGEVLVIRPPQKLPVGHVEHDAQKLQETYQRGRTVGEK